MGHLTHLRAPLAERAREKRRNRVTIVLAIIVTTLVVYGWWRVFHVTEAIEFLKAEPDAATASASSRASERTPG